MCISLTRILSKYLQRKCDNVGPRKTLFIDAPLSRTHTQTHTNTTRSRAKAIRNSCVDYDNALAWPGMEARRHVAACGMCDSFVTDAQYRIIFVVECISQIHSHTRVLCCKPNCKIPSHVVRVSYKNRKLISPAKRRCPHSRSRRRRRHRLFVFVSREYE